MIRSVLDRLRERALWVALGVGLLALVLAYQSNRPLFVDIGGPFDGPHTPGFYAQEQSGQANFRWAAYSSSLVFQGIGKPTAPFEVTLQLSSGRGPGSAPIDVRVAANGHPTAPLSLGPDSTPYAVTIDPTWLDVGGDLRLDFTSPVFSLKGDKRELGFVADFARVELPASLIVPSVWQIAWLLLCGVLLYLALSFIWLSTRAASLLVALFMMGCAGIVGFQRLFLTVFTGRMVITIVLALLIAALAEWAVLGMSGAAGWRGERSLPEWAWTGLRGLLIATALLKIGGLLYPHTFIVDSYFHLRLVTFMAEGRPWDEYFGKSLALAVMPKDEWGSARAFIPYSPFYYVVVAPLYWLPVPLALSVPVFAGVLETCKVALVFLFGLAIGGLRGAARRALTAAAVYAVIPATFLLQQWGNWPTQTSLWLLTLWATVTCLFWERITTRWVWAASTLVLLLAMLSYTVTAAYTGVFIGLLVVAGWIFAPKDRRRWAAIALSLVAATLLSLLIYYGQWIPTIIEETLPTFGRAVEEQGSLTTLRPTFGSFITANIGRAMQSYNLAILYALGFAGALWVLLARSVGSDRPPWRGQRGNVYGLVASRVRPALAVVDWPRIWLVSWLLTFPLFTLLDFWIDQALKEFWYALPAIAVVAGLWLLLLMSKAKSARVYSILAWLLWATLAWQSLSLWVFRLLFHNR